MRLPRIMPLKSPSAVRVLRFSYYLTVDGGHVDLFIHVDFPGGIFRSRSPQPSRWIPPRILYLLPSSLVKNESTARVKRKASLPQTLWPEISSRAFSLPLFRKVPSLERCNECKMVILFSAVGCADDQRNAVAALLR